MGKKKAKAQIQAQPEPPKFALAVNKTKTRSENQSKKSQTKKDKVKNRKEESEKKEQPQSWIPSAPSVPPPVAISSRPQTSSQSQGLGQCDSQLPASQKRQVSKPASFVKLSNYPRRRYDCINKDYQITIIPPGRRFIFFGWCGVTCLGGSVRIDGYNLQASSYESADKMFSVCAPFESGRPALFEATTPEPLKDTKCLRLKYRLKEVSSEFERIIEDWGPYKAAVLIIFRRAPIVVDLYKQMHDDLLYYRQNHWNPEDIDMFESPDWHFYREGTRIDIERALVNIDRKRKEGDSVTLVPCGGKGAGKSTFIRYMCNRLLQSDLPLYVLDVDIGQTEFTPSGCMSLVKVTKPLLDLPWAHQQADFDFSYFYGGVSPADDMSKYKRIFERLLNEYKNIRQPGSVLLINTLGWVEGPGLDALQHMINWAEPDYCFQLIAQGIKPASVLLRDATVAISIQRDLPLRSKSSEWSRFNPINLKPAALRDLRTVGYFANLLNKPIMSTLTLGRMYKVNFRDMTIATHEDLAAVDDHYFLGTINMQMVALCSTDEPLPARRLLNREYLPRIHTTDLASPIMRCYGFGIINAVDMEKMEFLILTPMSEANLSKITLIARGDYMTVPSIMARPGNGAPPMYSMEQIDESSGVHSNLYSSVNMDRQNKFRRIHFPNFG